MRLSKKGILETIICSMDPYVDVVFGAPYLAAVVWRDLKCTSGKDDLMLWFHDVAGENAFTWGTSSLPHGLHVFIRVVWPSTKTSSNPDTQVRLDSKALWGLHIFNLCL